MRIACPNCAAEYDVPDAALAAGPRWLKCARCGHHFQAQSLVPADEALAPAAPPAEPATPGEEAGAQPGGDRPPPARGPRHASPIDPPMPRLGDSPASAVDRFALAGWLATVAVLAGGLLAGYAWRAEIMAAWPPATRLFAAIGLS